ncbi:DUF4097 family beta strand repeat-containing protein [Hyalangium versicolor]|uniref:DUF4097 family beta strand repeat-containing protein n=1 Tax=Hyalangium versicolor TaxID=2861190 RepID=UPI001CCDD006|nr:DUF4097 family beta strand repeat-containing protein [Hyalangium versicolor]
MPRGSELNLSAVNAEVKVAGVEGEQEISTVDGRVETSGSQGAVSVSAVSGAVVLKPGVVGETSVSTVSGSVKLKMPKGTDAQLEFSSVGGSFNGQATALGGVKRKYGKGTHEIQVSTVSGELQVQQD